ncbi:MAG: hypothetical protein BroJett012_18920 [Betaproteobacteria bacterium]|nr:MAG: hypothetical protein BroJett012_18920 [Betaproteobacteria bacterium]
MLTQIPGLDYEVDGDLIHLEQNDGSGNIDRITLHRLHLRHLAEECGLLAPAPLPAVPLDLAGEPDDQGGLDEDGAAKPAPEQLELAA